MEEAQVMTEDLLSAAELADTLSRRIALNEPSLNRTAIRDALSNFLVWRQGAEVTLPGKAELTAYLAHRVTADGIAAAGTDFAYLQIAAGHIWGAAETSHFAMVLRDVRVTKKAPAMGEWERAEQAISRLPAAWRPPMLQHLELSRDGGRKAKRIERWSASHLAAVSRALTAWKTFCDQQGRESLPTGSSFEEYADVLSARTDNPVSAASVAHYLSRIYTGFATVICPGYSSDACEFVLRDWRERGDREGTPTKSGSQLVSGTAIYDLGFDLMARARAGRARGMRAALDFRNGVLLAIGISLPQRARALSALEFDRTLTLLDERTIHVHIPGCFIKQPEGHKEAHPYDKVLRNAGLAAALTEYAGEYRPLFDAGKVMFPSLHAPLQGITEKQIGRLAGNLTLREFGVRISIHRFRDNVATEISETMPNGGRLAPAVLGHRDLATTQRHYVHAEGFLVAQEYGDYVENRRTAPMDLLL